MPKDVSFCSTSGQNKKSWDKAIQTMNSWDDHVKVKMQVQNGYSETEIRRAKILRARKKLHFMLIGNVKPYQQMTFISMMIINCISIRHFWIRNRGASPCSAWRMPTTVFFRYWPHGCTYVTAKIHSFSIYEI